MRRAIKRVVLVAIVAIVTVSALPVLALDTGLQYGTATGLGTKDVREGIMSIVNLLFGFLGVLAIVGIVFGGFKMMTSGGNAEKTADGQKVVAAGVIGLVIIFLAYAIASFVINQLITATGAA